MKIILKPENWNEAFDLFAFVPFYTWKDFLTKKQLCFDQTEVEYVLIDPEKNKPKRLYFNTKDFEGYVRLDGALQLIDIEYVSKKYEKISSKKEILRMGSFFISKYSPSTWGIVVVNILMGIIFYFAKYFRYGFHNTQKILPYCDQSCIKNSHFLVMDFYSNMIVTLALMALGAFYFFCPRKIRQSDLWTFIKFYSFLILIVGATDSYKLVKKLQNPTVQAAFQVSYSPDNLKDISREIASELSKKK